VFFFGNHIFLFYYNNKIISSALTKTSREGAKAEAFAKAKNDVRGSVFFVHILRAPTSWSMCF
ncbi:hypothetical protein, partial [Bilophila wadsworthia]